MAEKSIQLRSVHSLHYQICQLLREIKRSMSATFTAYQAGKQSTGQDCPLVFIRFNTLDKTIQTAKKSKELIAMTRVNPKSV